VYNYRKNVIKKVSLVHTPTTIKRRYVMPIIVGNDIKIYWNDLTVEAQRQILKELHLPNDVCMEDSIALEHPIATLDYRVGNFKDNCPICGGDIIGDGFTVVRHCENADLPIDVEPDANTIYCSGE
jgi:hypothetical protein